MKQIELSELPERLDEALTTREKYHVRRGGVELGLFMPYVKPDPEQVRAEREATRRGIAWLRANDMLDAEILDNLERALRNPSLTDPSALSETVAVATQQASDSRSVGAIAYPAPHSKAVAEILARTVPRHIDIRDLLDQPDEEIRTGPSLVVERGGDIVGCLLPNKPRPDPREMAKEWEKLDRLIDAAVRNGYTREQMAEDFDLSKPFREEIY